MNFIIIPVFNDWKSLNKLLFEINENANTDNSTRVLVIDDFSSTKKSIEKKKLKKIKIIQVLRLNKNVGSQKAINIGLKYLKTINKNFYVTIMDGDGEDSSLEIKKMLNTAKKNKNSIVVSSRKGRNESLFIQSCYKIHLFLCFLFTGHWISFGNFSCFHSKNLVKILSDNSTWYAFSSGVVKNSNFIKVFAQRQKRYFDQSKMNFIGLADHSLRVISVFYKRVMIFSLIYFIIIFQLLNQIYIEIGLILLTFNLILLLTLFKHISYKNSKSLTMYIKKIY